MSVFSQTCQRAASQELLLNHFFRPLSPQLPTSQATFPQFSLKNFQPVGGTKAFSSQRDVIKWICKSNQSYDDKFPQEYQFLRPRQPCPNHTPQKDQGQNSLIGDEKVPLPLSPDTSGTRELYEYQFWATPLGETREATRWWTKGFQLANHLPQWNPTSCPS